MQPYIITKTLFMHKSELKTNSTLINCVIKEYKIEQGQL